MSLQRGSKCSAIVSVLTAPPGSTRTPPYGRWRKPGSEGEPLVQGPPPSWQAQERGLAGVGLSQGTTAPLSSQAWATPSTWPSLCHLRGHTGWCPEAQRWWAFSQATPR